MTVSDEWIDVAESDIDRTATFLSNLSQAEESRIAKKAAQARAGKPFDWHHCPDWEEHEGSPGMGIPWRNPDPSGERYFSITEIQEVLLRGHY